MCRLRTNAGYCRRTGRRVSLKRCAKCGGDDYSYSLFNAHAKKHRRAHTK